MNARRAPQVLFRVAAGPRIGFGHLLRCRALSRALRARPLVSVRGGAGARRTARALGCELTPRAGRRLHTVDLVVVDDPSPVHAAVWLRRASRAGVPVATIHDLGVGCHAADLVVDGSITHLDARRGTRALCGPRFTVLDPGVAAARDARSRRRAPRRRPRVLVALGGGSHVHRVAATLVAEISGRCPRAVIHVASGFAHSARRPLPGAARWINRPNGLARDLTTCDVVVTSGGVTLYEACAIGAPTVAMAVMPEQRPAVAAFAALGAVMDAGALADGDLAVQRAAVAVAQLLGDQVARRRCSWLARRLVDGLGALRVAGRLRELAGHAAERRRCHV
jgi:spore coat polysaccharide biosynthesis predicted glycosyltransferase SpsG